MRTDLKPRMSHALESIQLAGAPAGGASPATGASPGSEPAASRARVPVPSCYHCGEPCDRGAFEADGHAFCCAGCRTVFSLLSENGLNDFYRWGERPGIRVARPARPERWTFLDDPEVARRLLDFQNDRIARVTFHLPAIHCVACVWLLENLFRLHPGIGRSRVNFARREVSITFTPGQIRLGEVAALLERLGYEPALTLAELDRPAPEPHRKLARQIAVAGFAFGNIMLFSLPLYLGLDSLSGPAFQALFGNLSLLLALPVLVYSASDYWRSALASLRQRTLTLDVPIAAGLVALYAQSAGEILTRSGEGYLDSLAGLVFFLLCGRAFQQKTHDRLGFDRDYRGFFPLAAVRRTPAGEETVSISRLTVGDRLVIRHGELIPADARLVSGPGLVDYSFVTGESEPVERQEGDHLYAGGRQAGGAIEVETVKPVSQSYLTSLWNDEAFRKPRADTFESLTNRYSRRFTLLIIAIAAGAAMGWSLSGDAGRGLKAFTSVLIVACPCALALAAPFTLGTAQRCLARLGIFLRNSEVLETIARIDTLALDKTGTLTAAEASGVGFHGRALEASEAGWIAALCRQSAHPHARRIVRALGDPVDRPPVVDFVEIPGQGIAGMVAGRRWVAGSAAWLAARGVSADPGGLPGGSTVLVAVDGAYRGALVLENRLRPRVDHLVPELARRFELALLSGDNARERDRFAALFGTRARLHFNLSPQDKLAFIRRLQEGGRRVMMVGDGLNDAGALRQGDVGVAVVEGVGRFSPASDVILDAPMVPALGRLLDFAGRAATVVRIGFGISAAYNVVGVSIAASGILSPLICAILMPLSSLTVVLFAVGATRTAARWSGLPRAADPGSPPTPGTFAAPSEARTT